MGCRLSLLALCALAAALSGCAAKAPAVDLVGEWHASVTYEQELSTADDSAMIVAVAHLVQEHTFTFYADGRYSRRVQTQFLDARSFVPDVTEEALSALYAASSAPVTLNGTYRLHGNTLTLATEQALAAGDAAPIPYEAFYQTNTAYGAPVVKTRLTVTSDDNITVQGITLSQLPCR